MMNHNPGGQHRAPQGVSTFDGETEQERRERLRRGHAAVDAQLADFEKARLEAIGQDDVAF